MRGVIDENLQFDKKFPQYEKWEEFTERQNKLAPTGMMFI